MRASAASAASTESSYDRKLASIIDHTVMRPDLTTAELEQQCTLVRQYGFAGICVNTVHIPLAYRMLADSPVKVCTGVGFPLGASSYLLKALETRDAVAAGADEVDMVINIGAVKEGEFGLIEREIEAVMAAAGTKTVKIILEVCYLTPAEIVEVCKIACAMGAAFVKTSTGFGPGGATVEAVRLMRDTVGREIGVKAAGGITSRKFALELVEAGASRLGLSRSVEVVCDLGAPLG